MNITAVIIMLGMSIISGFVGGTGFAHFKDWSRYAFLSVGIVTSLLWLYVAVAYAIHAYKGRQP